MTTLLQSSSAATAMLVAFSATGLITLPGAIGAVLGANLGSAITSQAIAFNIGMLSVPAMVLGFALTRLPGPEWRRALGAALLGIGLLFFGLKTMSLALAPMAGNAVFQAAMVKVGTPWPGFLAGILAAVVLQSSTTTTAVAMAMMTAGQLPLPGALGIIIGAGIGTCSTAMVAAVGRGTAAKRVALAHLVFNLLTAAVAMPIVGWTATLVRHLSDDPARQLAHANVLFNLLPVALTLPFIRPFAALITALAPDHGRLQPLRIQGGALADVDILRLRLADLADRLAGAVGRHPPRRADTPAGAEALEEARTLEAECGQAAEALVRMARGNFPDAMRRRIAEMAALAENLSDIADTLQDGGGAPGDLPAGADDAPPMPGHIGAGLAGMRAACQGGLAALAATLRAAGPGTGTADGQRLAQAMQAQAEALWAAMEGELLAGNAVPAAEFRAANSLRDAYRRIAHLIDRAGRRAARLHAA